MIDYIKKNKHLCIAAFIFFLIQLPFLDQLSLLRGERDIMLSGYSLAKTGRDLYGNFLSLEFLGIDPFVPFFPMYVAALWWFIVPVKTVFLARLLFVFLSTTLPFLVYEIVKHITKEEKISFWTAILFCFSPGVFHLTRLTLEIGVAFPLLLGGILCKLKKKHIYSYLLFFFSFFSYHGFRPLIPVVLIYLEFFDFLQNKNISAFLKRSMLHIFFFVALFASSILIDGNLMKSRINDVAFSGFEKWSNQVIYERNTSQAPALITKAMNNKIISLFQYMRDVFIKGQDLGYLFLKGDDSSLYATTFTGQFFLTGIIFYFLGFFFLGKKAKKEYFYMAGFILVGLVPSIVNISYISYSIRSILSSVGYAFIMACGVMYLVDILKNKNQVKRMVFGFLSLCLFLEVGFFAYNYYGRRYITMSEMYFETERQIAKYMIAHKKPYRIYTHAPRETYFSYLFFNNTVDMREAQIIAKKGKPYKIDGFEIHECPVNPSFLKRNEIIMDTCLPEKMYEQFVNKKQYSDKIDYTNYSFRTAYFVFD